jgi:Flp pilus assembly pilin Flp
MFKKKLNKRANSLLEYALMAGVVSLALITMNIYIKRGVQARVADLSDYFLGTDHATESSAMTDTTSNTSSRINAIHNMEGILGGGTQINLDEDRTTRTRSQSDSYSN